MTIPLLSQLPAEPRADLAHVEVSADDDLSICVGDRVSVFPPGAWEPRHATVEAVRGDGLFLVHMAFGITKWCYERDLTLLIKAAAAAVGSEAQDG